MKNEQQSQNFSNLRQMFLLRDQLIMHGKIREKSNKTCNKTMLRDKLRVFVSRISPPKKLGRERRRVVLKSDLTVVATRILTSAF